MERNPETVHVIPVDDLRSHIEVGKYCHCKPSIVDGNIVIHNAYDGREFYEGDLAEYGETGTS